jgi:uncharacterized protein (DUF302 family)
MLKRVLIVASFWVIASCAHHPPKVLSMEYYEASTLKKYADVIAELKIAISEHNFRMTGHSRVGKVIRDRGTQGFPNYDTLQFCNLTHAKTLLEMSPHFIKYMPCNVVVYEYQGKVIVKTPLLPTNTPKVDLNIFAKKMNTMLKAIVDFAVEE